jgi:hypothetical protein
MDEVDAPGDALDLDTGNTAAAVLPEVDDQGQPSVDVEIEPAVEQVLRIVAAPLTPSSAVPRSPRRSCSSSNPAGL